MMISAAERPLLFILSGLAAAIALIVASYSLTHPSIYSFVVSKQFLPGTLSQDIVSVLVASGLYLCIGLIRRGYELAWLVWIGLLGYLFYTYALYSFDGIYTTLFLFYLAIISLSLYALILFFRRADLIRLGVVSGRRSPPRRSVAVLFLVLMALFVVLWLSILLPVINNRTPLDGNSIFVLDFSFVLPLLAIESKLLWEKAPLGDVLAIPLLIKAGTLGISVFIGTLLAPFLGQELALSAVFVYALLALGPLVFVVPFLRVLTVEP